MKKEIITLVVSTVSGFYAPLLPYAGLCTAMVILDFITAVQLGRRLRRRDGAAGGEAGKLSSRRFGRTVATLVKTYVALGIASATQMLLVRSETFDAVRFTAAAICFWQLISILENESTCSDARWARIARRYLADKARRHTGLDLEE